MKRERAYYQPSFLISRTRESVENKKRTQLVRTIEIEFTDDFREALKNYRNNRFIAKRSVRTVTFLRKQHRFPYYNVVEYDTPRRVRIVGTRHRIRSQFSNSFSRNACGSSPRRPWGGQWSSCIKTISRARAPIIKTRGRAVVTNDDNKPWRAITVYRTIVCLYFRRSPRRRVQ